MSYCAQCNADLNRPAALVKFETSHAVGDLTVITCSACNHPVGAQVDGAEIKWNDGILPPVLSNTSWAQCTCVNIGVHSLRRDPGCVTHRPNRALQTVLV